MAWQYLFTCIICERDINDLYERDSRDRHIEPVCRYCEGWRGSRVPPAGAFMDRRLTKIVSALADALNGEAHAIEWRGRYG